jgi:hypothetical protein
VRASSDDAQCASESARRVSRRELGLALGVGGVPGLGLNRAAEAAEVTAEADNVWKATAPRIAYSDFIQLVQSDRVAEVRAERLARWRVDDRHDSGEGAVCSGDAHAHAHAHALTGNRMSGTDVSSDICPFPVVPADTSSASL